MHREQGMHAHISVHLKKKILYIAHERMLRFLILYGIFIYNVEGIQGCTSINGYEQVPIFHREFIDHIMHEPVSDPVIQHHSLSVQGNKNARPYLEIHRTIGMHCR